MNKSPRLRAVQMGLGPIGLESLRLLAQQDWVDVVAGIDIHPDLVDQPLSELLGGEAPALVEGAKVCTSYEQAKALGPIDLMLHTVSSDPVVSMKQMEPAVRDGVSVVSTCEALLYPALTAPAEAQAMDALCQEHGGRVVGTGVNPGFVMDLMPIVATGVCRSVKAIRVERVVNATTRRGPLQKKVGSGMEPSAFQALFQQKKAGHAGYRESAALIGHAMGWPVTDIRETLEPVLAEQPIRTEHVTVEPGQVRGLHQFCKLYDGERLLVDLDLVMALEEPEAYDRVVIDGDPPLDLKFQGGVAGDVATVAAVINVARRIGDTPPGLKLMTDLPAPRWT